MVTNDSNKLFGLPTQDFISPKVQQLFDDTCAIKSQEIILNAAGLHVTEEDLRLEAIENGWYTPGCGTPLTAVGELMNIHGMKVQPYINASLYNLTSELAKGHPVIVGVDSGELWHPGIEENFEDTFNGCMPDHALIVSGIEFNEDFSDGIVNVIDPGTGEYCHAYGLEQFLDAWGDSDNFMISIL